MLNALSRLREPKTVNDWLIACKACWNRATKLKLVQENPFAQLQPQFAEGRQCVITAKGCLYFARPGMRVSC